MENIKKLFSGLSFLMEGFGILRRHPRLLPYVVIPFIIDILVFAGGIYLGATYISLWVTWAVGLIISPEAGLWYSVVYYPLLILLWLAFLVLLGYGVFIVGMIIASPFHSLLAERTLMKLGALEPKAFSFKEWFRTSWGLLKTSIKKSLVFGLLGIGIFICSFLPVVNVLGSFVACLIVAFDAMDYSFETKEWTFRKRIAFFKSELPLFGGMALCLGLTLLVPGLTLLFYPVAVVGAASRFSESKMLQKGV